MTDPAALPALPGAAPSLILRDGSLPDYDC